MGAIDYVTRSRGKNLQDAYTRAVENAIEEHGNDMYNGTISTTSSIRDVTNEYHSSKKEMNEFIDEKLNNSGKRDCFAICTSKPVENKNKIKSQVEHFVEKGTKKWELKYTVETFDGEIGRYDTKGAAVDAARKYTEKHLRPTTIHMKKVLSKGSTQVAKITYKASSEEREGTWILFCNAAC